MYIIGKNYIHIKSAQNAKTTTFVHILHVKFYRNFLLFTLLYMD